MEAAKDAADEIIPLIELMLLSRHSLFSIHRTVSSLKYTIIFVALRIQEQNKKKEIYERCIHVSYTHAYIQETYMYTRNTINGMTVSVKASF